MNMKNFFAPSTWRLGGAARRAATALLLCVMTCATAWASVPQGYDYIDASGTTHNTAMDGIGENDNPTVINSTNKPTTLSGWYVVSGNVNYTETVTLSDNTTIILADGAHLSIGTSSNRISSGNCIYADGKSLTIYGQTNQTGTLSVYNRLRNNAVYVAGYTQHGGTVTIDGTDQTALFLDDGDLTLTRGTLIVNASYNYHWNSIKLSNGHVTVSGGTLSANSYINADDVTVSGGTLTTTGAIICNATLGLTNANDYIKAREYWTTVKIADDQTLYDEAGNAYSGTLNSDEKAAIAGQMLTKVPNAVPTFLITYDLDGGQLPSGQTNPTSYTAESETFTLVNPVRNGYDFAGWTGTGLSSPTQTVTITQGETGIRSYRATWNEASNDISVSSDGNTYTILNATGWGMFCDLLAAADGKTFFSGKTVKLGADISVTQSAGSEGHEFMGTFDGDGKTLTVNITDTGEQGTAPFRIISNATIRNLHVTGSVTGTAHASGLVGKACAGTILIENCLVEANVNSTVGDTKGNKHCGGIVGHGFGGNNPVDLTLRNCVYAGTITCDKNYIGGLQGWSDGNTLTLENCLFAGNYAGKDGNTALFHPIALHNTGKTTNLTATNVFAAVAPTATNANFIAADGTKTTGRATAPAGLGNQVATYNYMDMTVYENGLLYNGLYYVAPTLSTDTDNAYLIHNEDDWTNFCDALYDNGTWNRFTGKTVKLANDISVSRMAGYDNHDFLGTFDGNHKTLTFTATATANYLAPFRNVLGNSDTDRAVIRDLNVNTNITAHDHRHTAGLIALVWGYVDVTNCNVTVDITATKGSTNTDLYPAGIASQVVKDAQIAVSGCTVGGTISTDGKYAGGIIGIAQGSASITNCVSSVTINSSTDGDGTHGGLVAVQGNYDGKTITIEGCVFKGKLLGASTHSCGGFVGWRSQTVTISNSLFVPVQVTINTVDGNTPCATFVRNGDSSTTITDCYYTTDFNDGVHFIGQGKQARSITAGENVTVGNAGTVNNNYTTSGLTFYNAGLSLTQPLPEGEEEVALYAAENDVVSLTLAHQDREGCTFIGYTATAGNLNGSTLTMPDENVTINAEYTYTAPSELTATDITFTTATLNWNGLQESYNVRYRPTIVILNEGFESGTMPDGWTRTGAYWQVTSGTGRDSHKGAATGNYNAGCVIYNSYDSDILITPVMDLGNVASATLSFNFWNTNRDGYINILKVYYRVNRGKWHLLYTYGNATGGWIPVTINLEGLAANYQIGFECESHWSYGMGIDDVMVTGINTSE